jgi:hypothetical protein
MTGSETKMCNFGQTRNEAGFAEMKPASGRNEAGFAEMKPASGRNEVGFAEMKPASGKMKPALPK